MKKIFLLLILGLFCLNGCTVENTAPPVTTSNPLDITTQDAANAPAAPTTEAPAEITTDVNTHMATPAPTEDEVSQSYSPENFYIENGDVRIQLYLTHADVTHDGVDDYIETCMYFPPETAGSGDLSKAMQGRLDVAGAIVQVYDGSKSTSEHLTDPIWSKEYSACHAGNGQVSIVYLDGLAYLLEGCLWQGQGFTGYYHTVLFWGETGLQYTKDEYSLQFYETDYSREEQIALVLNFKEQLEPWLSDAQLLVATDVELNKQFVTTENEQYIPQDYYDIVWQRWKK